MTHLKCAVLTTRHGIDVMLHRFITWFVDKAGWRHSRDTYPPR